MTQKERYAAVLAYLEQKSPSTDTMLVHRSAFQLLIAVILSAQCTDARVNMVSPALFAKYPTAEAMAKANAADILPYISSISYPNSKSRYLAETAKIIVNDYGGKVPDSIERLTTLPGVGRKTANVVEALAFNKATMAVDTHVFRVSHRIGLVPASATTPLATEKILLNNIDKSIVSKAHFWLLYHGRYTCTARNPKCGACALTEYCKYYSALTKQRNNARV